ncbi:type II secretion system GspH family protein [Patescibacteria group bacterium]|nr:type II secretion system GspH family protein [Patescibacteria group bacterium]
MKNINLKSQKGFSLVEMLVVMAIFLTMALVVSDIFMSVTFVQGKALAGQKSMNDLQYNLDQIASYIRSNKIDYESYLPSMTGRVSQLNLINDRGEKISIRKETENCVAPAQSCVRVRLNGFDTVLTSNQVDVNKLYFYISPLKNPYEYNEVEKKFEADAQPIVTVVFEGESLKFVANARQKINLQTSAASRNYER